MTYPYGTHGGPNVGLGLPGLPQRQSGAEIRPAVTANFVYAPDSVEGLALDGAVISRESNPNLSDLFPAGSWPQIASSMSSVANAFIGESSNCKPAMHPLGLHIAIPSSTSNGRVTVLQKGVSGNFDQKLTLVLTEPGSNTPQHACYSPDGKYLFVTIPASVRVFRVDGDTYTQLSATTNAGIGTTNLTNMSISCGMFESGLYSILLCVGGSENSARVFGFDGSVFGAPQVLHNSTEIVLPVNNTQISPDAKYLIFRLNGLANHRLYVHNGSSYTLRAITATVGATLYFLKYEFDAESKTLYGLFYNSSGTNYGIYAWDLSATGASNERAAGVGGTFQDILLAKDNVVVAMGVAAAVSPTRAKAYRLTSAGFIDLGNAPNNMYQAGATAGGVTPLDRSFFCAKLIADGLVTLNLNGNPREILVKPSPLHGFKLG